MFWIALAVVLIALVLLIAVKQKQSHNGEAGASYIRTPALFTPAERSFLSVLDLAVGKDFRVFGKVRVGDVLAPRTGQDWSALQKALNRHQPQAFRFHRAPPQNKFRALITLSFSQKRISTTTYLTFDTNNPRGNYAHS